MNILVTGGLGFIGSHTCVELIANQHQVVIVDNLVNSKPEVLDRIEKLTGVRPRFYPVDVTDSCALEAVFATHPELDGVIHFAGLKAVGESVEKPIAYYYNNLVSTMVLVDACVTHRINRIIFSSSATVYGDQPSPYREDMALMKTTNPYGETKAVSERILSDVAGANPTLAVTLLRYFNPVGAHPSGLLGEDPSGIPNNLMPYVSKVARGVLPILKIFGDDYPTPDGTGVRDYIHVVDLAKGHVKAVESDIQGVKVYNLGTGKGISVMEIVNAYAAVNGVEIPYEIAPRRPGDLASYYADAGKARDELGWVASLSLEDMVRDAYRFETSNSHL